MLKYLSRIYHSIQIKLDSHYLTMSCLTTVHISHSSSAEFFTTVDFYLSCALCLANDESIQCEPSF